MHRKPVLALMMLVSSLSVPIGGFHEIARSPAADACGLFTLGEAGKATGAHSDGPDRTRDRSPHELTERQMSL
jgi:hypothetical protein